MNDKKWKLKKKKKKWKLGKQCLEIKGMEWEGLKYIYQEFQMEIEKNSDDQPR